MFPFFRLRLGCILSLGGICVIPDLLHVYFFSGHGRRYVLHKFHYEVGPGGKVDVLDILE